MKNLGLLFTALFLFCCINSFAQSPFFPAASQWKYLDDGTDQGTAWQALTFNDASWKTGIGQLGFGEGDEATVLTSGFITYYFRKIVNIHDPNELSNIVFKIIHDDAMVLYINGVEIVRSPLLPQTGDITYLTGTDTYIPNDVENNFWDYPVDNSKFVAGDNIIAIEVHNQKTSSSDVSFDCQFIGDYTPTGVGEQDAIPVEFNLSQNYPNPFNPSTTIEFALPSSGFYTLKVYDLLGQQVAELINKEMLAGFHKINFSAANLSSGTYIYKLSGENVNISKKMIYMK